MSKRKNTIDNLQQILNRLDNVTKTGSCWRAFCPVHGDTRTQHLTITVKDRRILIYCHNCQADGLQVVRELSLSPTVLFID